MNGLLLDAGVLIGVAKESGENRPLYHSLKNEARNLVTIEEVCRECHDVPVKVLEELRISIEPSQKPIGFEKHGHLITNQFQAGRGRADAAVICHAIARHLDILTVDWRMRDAYKHLLRRLDKLPDDSLPFWFIPQIEIVRRGMFH